MGKFFRRDTDRKPLIKSSIKPKKKTDLCVRKKIKIPVMGDEFDV